MSRILLGTTLAWLVVATLHVAAQERGVAAVPRSTVARATPARTDPPKILPGTRPDVFTTIQGNALTSINSALAEAFVRLRDARIGKIVETQLTDRAGLFAFGSLDPGSYIVEIVDADRTAVLAASEVLYVGPGQIVSVVVKLPFRIAPFARLLGNMSTFAAVTTQAAAAGVLAAQASGAGTCDTLR